MKGGIGTASIDLGGGLVVGAVVAVNALGDVFEPDTGELIAGPRADDGDGMVSGLAEITSPGSVEASDSPLTNTTIGGRSYERAGEQGAGQQAGFRCSRWAGPRRASGAHHERRRYHICSGVRRVGPAR